MHANALMDVPLTDVCLRGSDFSIWVFVRGFLHHTVLEQGRKLGCSPTS